MVVLPGPVAIRSEPLLTVTVSAPLPAAISDWPVPEAEIIWPALSIVL